MKDERPFAGLKVLAVARVYAGPFAAYQLALHGADVITIEEPGVGDSSRTTGATAKMVGMGAAFLAHGANKKSLTLNLREPEAQEIFRKLAKDADVIIENMRSGSMDGYGLGYEAIHALNSRLVYCSLTGYGQTGPKKRDPGIDWVIQAASGLMSITGTQESGPLKIGAAVIDYTTGFAAALGIVTALYQRQRTGEGQYIDVSMLETALAGMSAVVSNVVNAGLETKLLGNRTNNPVANALMCSDTHLVIAASAERLRQRLFKAIGRPDLLADPRFASRELIRKNGDALYAELEVTLKTRTAEEWETFLNKAGVPCARIYKINEAVQQPQVKARNFYHVFESVPGVDGKIAVPMASYRLSKGAARVDSPPPRIGEHTDEVLKGLGYGEDKIEKLRRSGVI